MFDRIATYVRTKPRTTALIALVTLVGGALVLWDAQRGGYWYTFLPLLACVGMHGLMHGGHGHGHGAHGGSSKAPAVPASEPRKDDAA